MIRSGIVYHAKVKRSESEVTQSCPTLCDQWTVAYQALLSVGFSRQEYWSGLWFPSPGNLPEPGIKPRSPALQADAFPSEPLLHSVHQAKMGSLKDRNDVDLTEAEDNKKRWQEYTEELYKKDLNDSDNHDGVLTHLEPDILECEVKWTLGSITTNKASGGDGILAELFQVLKGDAVKVLHSICQQIWKTQQWPQDWKRSVFIPVPKKGSAKECSNYRTKHSSHMLAK